MSRRATAGQIACGWRWRSDAEGNRVAEAVNWTSPLPHEPKSPKVAPERAVKSQSKQGSLL